LSPISEEGAQQLGGAPLLDAAVDLRQMMGGRLVKQAGPCSTAPPFGS